MGQLGRSLGLGPRNLLVRIQPLGFIKGENKMCESKLCECGCGRAVKPGNRFIHGHNNRKRPPVVEFVEDVENVVEDDYLTVKIFTENPQVAKKVSWFRAIWNYILKLVKEQ